MRAHPSRLREKRRRERLFYAGLSLFGFVFVLACLVALSYVPQITIREIDVRGLSTIPEEDVRAAIERKLSEKYLFIVPKRNIFIYPKEEIEGALIEAFPKILSASVEFKGFNRISLAVAERSPAALWCGESREQAEACFFLDKEGYLYTEAPEFSGTVFVRYFGAGAGRVGSQFMTPQTFRSLSALAAELGKNIGDLESVEVAKGDAELHFLNGFMLKLALKDKPESVIERLSLALESDALKGKDLSALSYIDLRFGDRVVYRFK